MTHGASTGSPGRRPPDDEQARRTAEGHRRERRREHGPGRPPGRRDARCVRPPTALPAGSDRWAGVERLAGAQRIPVDRIERDPDQPRETFDAAELAELTASIRARGVLQPIRVRWDENRGVYLVIAGERRLRAARAAGLADVPCVVQEAPLSAAEVLLDQLAENLIRLDLEPIEQARAFQRLMDSQGWSARRLAEELHIDHDKVNRAVRLLELPAAVQEAVADGQLAPSTAFELSKLEDDAEREAVARRVVAEGLSRGDVAATVRQATGGRPRDRSKGRGGTGSKPGKVTSRTLRTPAGPRVTVELSRGLTPERIVQALEQALEQARGELAPADGEGRGEAA